MVVIGIFCKLCWSNMGFRRLGNALIFAAYFCYAVAKNLPVCDLKLDSQATEESMVLSLKRLVVSDQDDAERVAIKNALLNHLVRQPELRSLFNCKNSRLLQEEDDGDDGDDGGGGGGAGGAGGAAGGVLDNQNVLNGVRRILANVFTGNLIGVVQESVGLRSPEGVSTVFTDVLSTLFGSQATAGITGVIGNITTTAIPLQVTTVQYTPYGQAQAQGLSPLQLQQLQALTPQQIAVLQGIRNQQIQGQQIIGRPVVAQQPAPNTRPAGVQGGVVGNRRRVTPKPQQQEDEDNYEEDDNN